MRLATWCPGLRVTCLGSSDVLPSGTGRRLRSSVSRGAVNVCLTSYAALRARPSRYNKIKWSVVVLDQMHYLLRTSYPYEQAGSVEKATFGSSILRENLIASTDIERRSNDRYFSDWLDLIFQLKFTGHRLLLLNCSPDLLGECCTYRLFELTKLLLLYEPATSSWTEELFSTALNLRRAVDAESQQRSRPSRRQIIKLLDPFILRIDEDEEFDSCIEETVVASPMTPIQQKHHDRVLSNSVARNAIKTGNLLDLLSTVSAASRICSHICLLGTGFAQSSSALNDLLFDLESSTQPIPGPLIFPPRSDPHDHNSNTLLYDCPHSVLNAVRLLRQSELSEITTQGFSLATALSEPPHIRDRIAKLMATPDQLSPTPMETAVCNPQTVRPGHVNHNPHGSAIDSLSVDSIRSKLQAHMSNGFSDPTEPVDHNAPRVLDFSGISIARGKRFWSPSLSSTSPPLKRRKLVGGSDDSSQPVNGTNSSFMEFINTLKLHVQSSGTVAADPRKFAVSDGLLTVLEKKIPRLTGLSFDGCDAKKLRHLPGVRQSSGNSHMVNNVVNHSPGGLCNNVNRPAVRDGEDDSSRLLFRGLMYFDNKRRCTQLTGFSDWSSSGICRLLDAHSPKRSTSLFTTPSLVCRLRTESRSTLEVWNVVRHALNSYPSFSTKSFALLCSRQPVAAVPSPQQASAASDSDCGFPLVDSLRHYTERLHCFVERSRWLSPTSSVLSPHYLPGVWRDCTSTPVGRLFEQSGKFCTLHNILCDLTGHAHGRRPRCVFLVGHQTALLDLIEAYLQAVSPLRNLPRLRLHVLDLVTSTGYQLVTQANEWRRDGLPLIVLVNARSPAIGSLCSLRAGPDCCVVVCDVDWRSDVTDNFRSMVHNWALNGLVDAAPSHLLPSVTPSTTPLRVYKIVTTGSNHQFGYCGAIRSSSVEASLSRGVACRMLPGAVFQAQANATKPGSSGQPIGSTEASDTRALFHARVQPNVVSELLSPQLVSHLHWERRSAVARRPPQSVEAFSPTGVNQSLTAAVAVIKQEPVSYSSASSVTSSMSFEPRSKRRNDSGNLTCADDEENGFQEREPLGEHLLHHALELYEDPLDAQAWCFQQAEEATLSQEFYPDQVRINDPESPSGYLPAPLLWPDTCQDLDRLDESTLPSSMSAMFSYTTDQKTSWEVGHFELRSHLSWLTDIAAGHSLDTDTSTYADDEDLLCYHRSVSPMEVEDSYSGLEASTGIPALTQLDDLPIWGPFDLGWKSAVDVSKQHSGIAAGQTGLLTDYRGGEDDSDWGYESEPMSEHELPPLPPPPPPPPPASPAPTPALAAAPLGQQQHLQHQQSLKRSAPSISPQALARPGLPNSGSFTRGSGATSVKRRKLTGAALAVVSKKAFLSSGASLPASSAPGSIPCTPANKDDGVAQSDPSSSQASRDGIGALGSGAHTSCVTTVLAPATPVVGVSHSGNSVIVFPSPEFTSGASKLHIPRATFSREAGNVRSSRLRRVNPTSNAAICVTGSGFTVLPSPAASGGTTTSTTGIPSSAQICKTPSYHNQGSQAWARYNSHGPVGLSTRHTSASLSVASMRFGQLSTTMQPSGPGMMSYGQSGRDPSAGNAHHLRRPSDWFVYEEAALHQCMTKLQGLPFCCSSSVGQSTGSQQSPQAPAGNFRLAEFFVNSYFPTRAYRSARQCMVVSSKMQAVSATAIAAIGAVGGSCPTSGADDDQSARGVGSAVTLPSIPSVATPSPGPTGRKVKNKMKSSAAVVAAAAAASVSSSSANTSAERGLNTCDSLLAISRFRGFLVYQSLQTAMSSPAQAEYSSKLRGQLSHLISAIKAVEDVQAGLLRKAVHEALFPSPAPVLPVPMPAYRPLGSGLRRTASLLGGVTYVTHHPQHHPLHHHHHHVAPHYHHQLTSGVVAGATGVSPAGGAGPVASLYGHPHTLSGASATASSYSPIAPALLAHNRHHRHHVSPGMYDHSTGSSSAPGAADPPSSVGHASAGMLSTGGHSGPVIQKNPTHIAALQEHNINPDTLITPAMVIKNKEEREARLRAEAQLASVTTCVGTTGATSGSAITSGTVAMASTNIASHLMQQQHQQQQQIQQQTHHHQASAFLHRAPSPTPSSVALPSGSHFSSHQALGSSLSGGSPLHGLNSTTTSSTYATGSSASSSLAYASSSRQQQQRAATSIMLPVRTGFPSHCLPGASTIIALPQHTSAGSVTIQQYSQHHLQHRVLAGTGGSPTAQGGVKQQQQKQQPTATGASAITGTGISRKYPPGVDSLMATGDGGSGNPASVMTTAGGDMLNSGSLTPVSWRSATTGRSFTASVIGSAAAAGGNSQAVVSSASPAALIRRAGIFTSATSGHFQESSALTTLSRVTSSGHLQTSPATVVSTGQLVAAKSGTTTPTGYVLQSRGQFLPVGAPGRGVLASLATGVASGATSVAQGTHISSLPQILRPVGALRGTVIQPAAAAYVRTISGSSTPLVPVAAGHFASRLGAPTTGVVSTPTIMHGRVTLAGVSAIQPSVVASVPRSGLSRSTTSSGGGASASAAGARGHAVGAVAANSGGVLPQHLRIADSGSVVLSSSSPSVKRTPDTPATSSGGGRGGVGAPTVATAPQQGSSDVADIEQFLN